MSVPRLAGTVIGGCQRIGRRRRLMRRLAVGLRVASEQRLLLGASPTTLAAIADVDVSRPLAAE